MKAILVIDMPEDCNGCLCLEDEERYCRGDEKYFRYCGLGNKKPEWCPLRPLPKKKEPFYDINEGDYDKRIDGWNDCLDEILGEQK